MVSERDLGEAKQLVREVDEYWSTHFPELTVQHFWQRFQVGMVAIYVMTDHKDMAAMERHSKLESWPDPERAQELVNRWFDVFIEGASETVVVESL